MAEAFSVTKHGVLHSARDEEEAVARSESNSPSSMHRESLCCCCHCSSDFIFLKAFARHWKLMIIIHHRRLTSGAAAVSLNFKFWNRDTDLIQVLDILILLTSIMAFY
eukprot:g4514.t1